VDLNLDMWRYFRPRKHAGLWAEQVEREVHALRTDSGQRATEERSWNDKTTNAGQDILLGDRANFTL